MRWLSLSLFVMVACTACSSTPSSTPDGAASGAASVTVPEYGTSNDASPPAASPYDALPETVRARLGEKFTGDFPEMVKRRVIRAASSSTARSTSSIAANSAVWYMSRCGSSRSRSTSG